MILKMRNKQFEIRIIIWSLYSVKKSKQAGWNKCRENLNEFYKQACYLLRFQLLKVETVWWFAKAYMVLSLRWQSWIQNITLLMQDKDYVTKFFMSTGPQAYISFSISIQLNIWILCHDYFVLKSAGVSKFEVIIKSKGSDRFVQYSK